MDSLEAARRIPGSTYRLQLDRTFTFADAREVVPYLDALGITDCYLSPLLAPSSASSHGYDVSDHGRLNEALGTEADYAAFADALRARGMGQILDVVPNHMGIAGNRNAWWMDVLENGPASPHAGSFDIDWDPLKPELKNKVLLPILGDQYGRVLENQELALEFREGAFFVRYGDTLLPVAPRSYARVLRVGLDESLAALGPDDPQALELQSILTALGHLPPQTETDPARLEERNRERVVIKRRLGALCAESPAVAAHVEAAVRRLNGVKGDPTSFDLLDELLGAQAYRLAFWQVAADEINYRRFFDINDLAAIRMEEPAVFAAAHRLIFRLVREGWVTGLRVDHPDGLYAPAQYLAALQRHCWIERSLGSDPGADAAARAALEGEYDRRLATEPRGAGARPFYIVVEKILAPGEDLPAHRSVDGTTGYELLAALNGLFVDGGAARAAEDTWARFVGHRPRFDDVVYAAKKLVMDTSMSSELSMLGHRLARLSERHRVSRDFTDRSLTAALREIIACFPVYRTYIDDAAAGVSERDRRYIEQAVALATWRNPGTSAFVFDFVRDLLCLEFPAGRSEAERQAQLAFVRKFQQLTGPITAKGVEDTAFYRYNRLVSLNEVGGDPGRFGTPPERFHQLNALRQERWPGSLSATSTHDTKRSEDVRVRIAVLSEIPREWRQHVRAWHRLNRRHRGVVGTQPAPSEDEEYLLYQTLVGAWPLGSPTDDEYRDFVARIQRFVYKALREAKVNASWVNPRPEYDAAVRRFVAAILDRSAPNPFLDDFVPFQRDVAAWGMSSALSQTLLKIAVPGVPDFYQGTELWDLSLVDPDNRRPVDFALRRRTLEALTAEIEQTGDLASLARKLVEAKEDGRVKLYVVRQALALRRARAALFREGAYRALEVRGPLAAHVIAFARVRGPEVVLALAPRLWARRPAAEPPFGRASWPDDTRLVVPAELGGRYRNAFTDERLEARDGVLPVADALASFPVALLEREG